MTVWPDGGEGAPIPPVALAMTNWIEVSSMNGVAIGALWLIGIFRLLSTVRSGPCLLLLGLKAQLSP